MKEHVGDELTNDYYKGLLKPGFYYIEIDQPNPNRIIFGIDYYDGKKFLLNKVRSVQIRVPCYEQFCGEGAELNTYRMVLKEHYDGKFENWAKEFNARKTE